MSYLEKIQTTEETAGFPLKSLGIPQLNNLFIPIGLVGNLNIKNEEKRGGGSIKVPVPLPKNRVETNTVFGGTIPDPIFDSFQKQ